MARRYCSGSPNFGQETQTCCERHDAAYSAGSGATRLQADTALLICVSAAGMPWRAIAMFLAVRTFGWLHYRG